MQDRRNIGQLYEKCACFKTCNIQTIQIKISSIEVGGWMTKFNTESQTGVLSSVT